MEECTENEEHPMEDGQMKRRSGEEKRRRKDVRRRSEEQEENRKRTGGIVSALWLRLTNIVAL